LPAAGTDGWRQQLKPERYRAARRQHRPEDGAGAFRADAGNRHPGG
jgi:hypothetical protein